MDGLASAGRDLLYADGSWAGVVSAHPLGRRAGGGVLLRSGLPVGAGAAAAILTPIGRRVIDRFCVAANRQSIRRSRPVERPEKYGLYDSFLPERVEVPAIV